MDFVAPIMLVGALGVAVPVAIHLIGRRRAKVVPFAAVSFLLGSNRKVARRFQLRELLLLLVRAAVCLAIPLALSKPYTSCVASGPQVERGPQAAVLVIDNSFGSTYVYDDETLLSRAKGYAYSILEQLGPEADVAIVLAAQGADGPSELSRDHIRLRDVISDIDPSFRPADTTTALRNAAALLTKSGHERKTVFIMSPLAATGFRIDEPPWAPDTGPLLRVVTLVENAAFDNLAVTSVSVEPNPASGSRGVRITAEIANFGDTPVDQRGIGVRIADRVVARGLVSLTPGERLKRSFLASLPPQTRSTDVVVELDRDALSVDDKRYVRAELRDEVRVLLVNGDPHTDRHEDELFYLEAALRPGDRSDSGTSLAKVTRDELDATRLTDFDVVVLANVRALDSQKVAELERWVRDGGGLLIAPGDNVDADDYNETMQPLMPQQLRTPLDVSYGTRGAERTSRAQRLVKFEVDHPIFSVFSKDAPGLREATFTKLMLLGPTSQVDDRRVLARYSNGAAAMVEARSGKGRLMLLTSTIDRDWNNLAIHPGYLPLMQQTVRYLARKQSQFQRKAVFVGRSTELRVGPDDTRLEVLGPDGTRTVIEGESLQARKLTRFSRTANPGFYRVQATDQSGVARPREEAYFAVNLDPLGSDLRPVAPEHMPTSGSQHDTASGTQHKRRIELWHALAAGLLLLLLLESVLVLR